MISLNFWNVLFIHLLITPPSVVISLILQIGRLQPLPSLQTLIKSQGGQTLGICVSILTNLSLSLSLFLWKDTLANPPIYFLLTILLKKFTHSNSWVSHSAMKCLWRITFLSWPPKPACDSAFSVVQSPFLAHLNSCPPTRLSSTAWWSTGLSSGLTPLPYILLSFVVIGTSCCGGIGSDGVSNKVLNCRCVWTIFKTWWQRWDVEDQQAIWLLVSFTFLNRYVVRTWRIVVTERTVVLQHG